MNSTIEFLESIAKLEPSKQVEQMNFFLAQQMGHEAANWKFKFELLEGQWQSLMTAILECDPIPASNRPGNRLEPPAQVVRRIKAERDKLAAFKSYVHQRLDDAGIPADPPSKHKEEGCRIRGRLDLLLAARNECDRLREEIRKASGEYEKLLHDLGCRNSCMGWVNERTESAELSRTAKVMQERADYWKSKKADVEKELTERFAELRQAAQGVCGYLINLSDGTVVAESPIPLANLRKLEALL